MRRQEQKNERRAKEIEERRRRRRDEVGCKGRNEHQKGEERTRKNKMRQLWTTYDM